MNEPDNTPLVTVCIPSYNHDRFVGESIQGILDQTYPNIELIIIDDGSSDSSVEVIESYRKTCERRFLRFEIRSRPNKGLSATLNEALEWAHGEYFSPIASDDIALPNKIEVLLPEINGKIHIAGAFGGVKIIDGTGAEIEQKAHPGIWNFSEIILGQAYLPAPTALLRTADVRRVRGYNEKSLIEDWSMWLKLTEGDFLQLVTIPDMVTSYRIHGQNTHKRVHDMHKARVDIIEQYGDHSLYRKALACAAATSAIGAAEQSISSSMIYLSKAWGAPTSMWIQALAKGVLPSSVYQTILRGYWNRKK